MPDKQPNDQNQRNDKNFERADNVEWKTPTKVINYLSSVSLV